ncbi:hypothetical protein Dimus_009295 [Dionaea muscipula]
MEVGSATTLWLSHRHVWPAKDPLVVINADGESRSGLVRGKSDIEISYLELVMTNLTHQQANCNEMVEDPVVGGDGDDGLDLGGDDGGVEVVTNEAWKLSGSSFRGSLFLVWTSRSMVVYWVSPVKSDRSMTKGVEVVNVDDFVSQRPEDDGGVVVVGVKTGDAVIEKGIEAIGVVGKE